MGIVSLLWLNLVMDTLAALALATEKPHGNIIRTAPIRSHDKIISNLIWRQIYGIDVYILGVMIFNIFFAASIWDLDYDSSESNFDSGVSTDSGIFYTILFNLFMYMQIFNFFNARIINVRAHNVCENLLSNLYFVIIVLIIFLGSILLVPPWKRRNGHLLTY